MKKKEFLKIFNNHCVLVDICMKYYEKYNDLLNAFSDEEEICGIYLLDREEFKSREKFDAYLRENERTPEKVEMTLNSLYDSLVDFGKNPQAARQSAAKKNMRKASLVRVGIVSGFLLTVAAAIIVITALGLANVIPPDKSETLSTLFGTLDCIFGIIFFVYEIINDKVKEDEINSGNPEMIEKYININNSKVALGTKSKVVDKSRTVNNYNTYNYHENK